MPANTARVVYGTIVVATLLAAESAQARTEDRGRSDRSGTEGKDGGHYSQKNEDC